MKKRIYQNVVAYTDEDIQIIMERQVLGELLHLPLSVGMFHMLFTNWKLARKYLEKGEQNV